MAPLRAADIALALAVVAVWGTNFVVIKAGLRDLPPFAFDALRFVSRPLRPRAAQEA
jgi:O-acetylserine/cysteine efflux transporter